MATLSLVYQAPILQCLFDPGPGAASRLAMVSTPATMAWIVSVFIAALVLAVYLNRRHRNAVRQFALAEGWSVSERNALGLGASIEALFPDRSFSCDVVMTVETGPRKLYLIDGTYAHRGPKADMHPAAACLLESDRLKGVSCRVEIRTLHWLDRALLPGQVTLDDPELARQYTVVSEAPVAARALLSGRAREVLLTYAAQSSSNPVEIAMGPGGLALITSSVSGSESWNSLLELARDIESSVQPETTPHSA